MALETLTAHAGKPEEYSLVIGPGLEGQLCEIINKEARGYRVALLTDSVVKKIWGKQLLLNLQASGINAELFDFPQGERNKNQKTVTELQHQLLERRFGRDTLIIALGGGVVGDLAGFVAATYLRGVPYINVPTTLLAMVDSAIGGKVGIDTPYGKNTIGAFWLPRAVIMDIQYIGRLPRHEVINGLLEAVKTFFTSDRNDLENALKLDLEEPLKTGEILQRIIYASAKFKVGITERDVREKNERRVLNFGHTIGHALELLSEYTISHGWCVGYGILVEAKISELLGILSEAESREIFRSLEHFGILPADFPKYPAEKIIEATMRDKKVREGIPYYVLLESLGSVHKKDGQYAHPVDAKIVQKALEIFVK